MNPQIMFSVKISKKIKFSFFTAAKRASFHNGPLHTRSINKIEVVLYTAGNHVIRNVYDMCKL